MRLGAPNAVQVADRFHLLQNLADVLEQVLGSHRQALKAVETRASCRDGAGKRVTSGTHCATSFDTRAVPKHRAATPATLGSV